MATFSVVVLAQILFILFTCGLQHGFATQTKPLFSDKTPYHFISKTLIKPPRCEAVHVNMVIRHGSRYPGTHRINKMKEMLRNINKFFLSNSTFTYKGLTLPWTLPSDITSSADKEMSRLGSEEMYAIAKRLQEVFSVVLGHGYSNTNYSFISTDKLRSSQSAVAFSQGLFEGRGFLGPGKYQPVAVKFSGSYNNDRVLRIFEACPRWQKLTGKKDPRGEHTKFMNGPEMRKVARNISARLNLTKSITLRPHMIIEMFLMCAFGTQTDSADVSWCSVFEEEDLKVLEYLNDLKIYWDRSYGRKINYKMSCPLYKEIAGSIERFLAVGYPHGIFRFAHTGTVVPLLTMLGLYNDTVTPRADNYDQQANRKFRVSDVVPMSGNVAFVVYNCSSQRAKSKSDGDSGECSECRESPKGTTFSVANMKVQLLVNEVAVPMPACRGKMYCSLQRFFSYYAHIKNNCDFKTVCGVRRKKPNKRPTD